MRSAASSTGPGTSAGDLLFSSVTSIVPPAAVRPGARLLCPAACFARPSTGGPLPRSPAVPPRLPARPGRPRGVRSGLLHRPAHITGRDPVGPDLVPVLPPDLNRFPGPGDRQRYNVHVLTVRPAQSGDDRDARLGTSDAAMRDGTGNAGNCGHWADPSEIPTHPGSTRIPLYLQSNTSSSPERDLLLYARVPAEQIHTIDCCSSGSSSAYVAGQVPRPWASPVARGPGPEAGTCLGRRL